MDESTGHQYDTITVGVDGSAGAQHALEWAAAEAALRGSRLRIVHASRPISASEAGWMARSGTSLEWVRADAEATAQHLVKEAAEVVRESYPDLEVDTVTALEDPRSMLLAESSKVDLVVVGSRGRGPIRSLLLGSVGVALVRHSSSRVAVVRLRTTGDRRGVLVGATGRASSLPALRVAFEEAELRGTTVTVLHCALDHEMDTSHWVDLREPEVRDNNHLSTIRRLVAELSADHPEVDVRIKFVRGAADRCLVDMARGAELTVIGRHGSTGLDTLGLGSVSTPVVEHADGVVLVVPE